MMNRYLTFLILLFIFACSCKNNNSENEIIVNKLLSYSFEVPPSPQLSSLPIFIRQSETLIYIATAYDLKRYYDDKNFSHEISFSEFLLNSFNQEMIFNDTCNFFNSFRLDTKIYEEYIQNDFEFIVNEYTTRDNDGYILKSTGMSFETESSVSYVFFLNYYFAIFDDVDGETIYVTFRECSNIPPKKKNE